MLKNAEKGFIILVCFFCFLFVKPNAAYAQSSLDSLSIEELVALYDYQWNQVFNLVIPSCYQSPQIWQNSCEIIEQQWGIYFTQFANYIEQRRVLEG